MDVNRSLVVCNQRGAKGEGMNNSHGTRLFTHCWHLAPQRENQARTSALGISLCRYVAGRVEGYTYIFLPANLCEVTLFFPFKQDVKKKRKRKHQKVTVFLLVINTRLVFILHKCGRGCGNILLLFFYKQSVN